MFSALNTLSEYVYFYISKNIISYIFYIAFKIVESLQCILKLKVRTAFVSIFGKGYVSYANILPNDVTASGKSFIFVRNKRVLKTEPWGTSAVTLCRGLSV